MNSLIWKGVPSTTIDGLLISELPPISKPPMRVKETMIDGRDGSIIEELGYATYDKNVVIGLHGNFDINKVIKYFSGEGEVVFSNEPEKAYTAKIVGQIDYNRLLRYRQAVIPFRVQPFKHKYNEAYKETQTATVTGTNLVLKDSGNTQLRIATQAESVIVHGKNLVNTKGFAIGSNKTQESFDDGYRIVASGGKNSAYTHSSCYLPLAMRGKSYALVCDEIVRHKAEVLSGAQVIVRTDAESKYYGIYRSGESVGFAVPDDATLIEIGIYTNNSSIQLTEDNIVTITGLRIVPVEFRNDPWIKFDGLQTLSPVDGVSNTTGYYPVTVISNADNVAMTAEYFKHYEVFNEGLENSKPKMVLKGSGTVGISVNGILIFEYTFPDGENEVVIDSQTEDAYLGTVLKNRNMVGEFPVFTPGINVVEWSGNVSSIEILPRSRWI